MKILVSNDDGIFVEGIWSLVNGLVVVGYEVFVVCFDKECLVIGYGLILY